MRLLQNTADARDRTALGVAPPVKILRCCARATRSNKLSETGWAWRGCRGLGRLPAELPRPCHGPAT
eukprot:5303554-Lingulodinium_polyedra.AAC.1